MVAIDYAGQAAPWDELRSFALDHNLFLIEDAAPSLGGKYRGKSLGLLGDIGITSFHMAKTFTTVEGGMIFLHDENLDARARMIRSHGESLDIKYRHVELGHNYRMTDLHAAVGIAQISRYNEVLANRAMAANYYSKHLQHIKGVTIPEVLPGNEHSWFLYPVLVQQRDQVRDYLAEMGIGTNVSWPYPAYEQPYLKKFSNGAHPVTEDICKRVLCLPMFYGITLEEQDCVIASLEQAVSKI